MSKIETHLYIMIGIVTVSHWSGKGIGMAEALVYVMLGLIIVAYWALEVYSARLDKANEPSEAEKKIDKTVKDMDELKTKMNQVMLKMGFTIK